MSDILKDRAQKIKLLLTDCDGVLTDGCVYYSERGEELKKFSLRDGMGVERLRNLAGVETGIITGEVSPSVIKRAEKLKITELHLGVKDKPAVFYEIIDRLNLKPEEVAYIGDDFTDVVVMRRVGFAIATANARPEMKPIAHYVTEAPGGQGAVREVIELLLKAQGKWDGILKHYEICLEK